MKNIDINKVLESFSKMSGISIEDTKEYVTLAKLSIDEVTEKTREGLVLDEKAELKLTYLASAILYYRYLLFTDNGNSNIVSLGKIKNGGLDLIFTSRVIKDEALSACKNYLVDDDFIFERIEFYE